MSAGQDFASIRNSSALERISAVPPQVFQSDRDESVGGPSGCSFRRTTATASRAGGTRLDRCNRRVQRRPPAEGTVRPRAQSYHDERYDSCRLWALAVAVFERRHEIHCIEYPPSEDESLQFVLTPPSNPVRVECV
jgi:hypothetical protein